MRDWTTPARNTYAIEGQIVWIRLTRGEEGCIDLIDWERVKTRKWYATSGGYVATTYGKGRKKLYLHSLISGLKRVDHWDLNGFNNRRKNLRPCTRSQNQANRGLPRSNKTGFKGVSVCRRKGLHKFQSNSAGEYLGVYETAEEAARAYDRHAANRFGKFARLNFPISQTQN